MDVSEACGKLITGFNAMAAERIQREVRLIYQGRVDRFCPGSSG